jgi:hypothetical protein
MRLLNVRTLEIEEFIGSEPPRYAILSHTWGSSEASYGSWRGRWSVWWRSREPGFFKIVAACKQATHDGLGYVWVDTLCIDKTSSSELSEAINSMFAWYRDAAVCYIYLADVPPPKTSAQLFFLVEDFKGPFYQSRWFTRGWTLQELLAPSNAVFYSNTWTLLGTKSSLSRPISRITGVDELCITGSKTLSQYSVAQRMSWAADRSTTRVEDIAYCLLGIFDINMPLLYGEGDKAFRRLQQEIIRVYNDHSFLVHDSEDFLHDGIFAKHPRNFRNETIQLDRHHRHDTLSFALTNAGLSLTTHLFETLSKYDYRLARLDCGEFDHKGCRRVYVFMPVIVVRPSPDDRHLMCHRINYPSTLIKATVDEELDGPSPNCSDYSDSPHTYTLVHQGYHAKELEMLTYSGSVGQVGFMPIFPRNDCHSEVIASWPPGGLRWDSHQILPALFVPSDTKLDGIIVLKHRPFPLSRRGDTEGMAAIYLATEYNPVQTGTGSIRWCCTLLKPEISWLYRPPGEAKLRALAAAERDRLRSPGVSTWPHWDRRGDIIVTARMRFENSWHRPCREVVMVEVVFDAHRMFHFMFPNIDPGWGENSIKSSQIVPAVAEDSVSDHDLERERAVEDQQS